MKKDRLRNQIFEKYPETWVMKKAREDFEPLTKPWVYIPAVFVIGFAILIILKLLT